MDTKEFIETSFFVVISALFVFVPVVLYIHFIIRRNNIKNYQHDNNYKPHRIQLEDYLWLLGLTIAQMAMLTWLHTIFRF